MSQACNIFKKETLAQVFPVNLKKSLKAPFLQNTSGLLLLLVKGSVLNTPLVWHSFGILVYMVLLLN